MQEMQESGRLDAWFTLGFGQMATSGSSELFHGKMSTASSGKQQMRSDSPCAESFHHRREAFTLLCSNVGSPLPCSLHKSLRQLTPALMQGT